jgi:DNA topoisomerase-3
VGVKEKNSENTHILLGRGIEIQQAGWRGVLNWKEEDEEQNDTKLPPLTEGETVNELERPHSEEQKTKPKPLLTEATLLKEMETCGKEIDDEELRDAMKESGLGTPATRAAIIETLFARNYMERKKKALVPTPAGLFVYEKVKDKKIAQPVLTGEWEYKLENIRKGEIAPAVFMSDIIEYTKELLEEIRLMDVSGAENMRAPNACAGVPCPKCKKGFVRQSPKNKDQYYCSDYKNGCDFSFWNKEIFGKKLTEKMVSDLLGKRKTGVLKGFVSGKGNKFDAPLILKEVESKKYAGKKVFVAQVEFQQKQ